MAAIAKPAPAVRIEDGASIGRSYSALESAWGAHGAKSIPGLGAQRRALRTKSFTPYAEGQTPVLESATMALVNLRSASRADVLAYFRNTWQLTDTLFSALRDDSVFYMVPDKLRRPLIFYFGHPAALYINKMHQAGLVDHVHPYFQKLFETGVDEMSWDDMDAMQDEDFAWPDVPAVMEFRERIKAAVEAAILERMPEPATAGPVTQESPWWSLFMGFEHERIHLETSSVLIHQLPIDAVVAPPGWRTAPTFAPRPELAPVNSLVSVPATRVALGKPVDYPSFGWDNEYGHRHVEVPAFQASAYLATNAEFLPFVQAGGYEQRQWWVSPTGDDEGWRWRQYRNATHPSFWVASSHPDMQRFHGGVPGNPYQKDDGHPRAGTDAAWKLRTIFDIIAMPWDWPVEVNYLEAAAFLRWKAAQDAVSEPGVTYRVLTEAEYHAARADPCPFPDTDVAKGTVMAGAGAGHGRRGAAANGAAVRPIGKAGAAARHSDKQGEGGGGSEGEQTPGLEVEVSGKGVEDEAAGATDVILQPVAPGNLNWRWHSSTPVDYYGPSAAGFYDTHGNAWEWVEDHFAPLPGFEIHYLYDDFSSPCFDGWHTMIMGGSWVSTGDQASSYARYHFRRHFFQHLGFRYVKVPAAAPEPYPGAAAGVANLWEGAMSSVARDITDGFAPLATRLAFPSALVAPETSMAYPANLARLVEKAYAAHAAPAPGAPALPPASAARVLHLGCGVGAGSFELAKAFGGVVGVDVREPAIRHARILQHHGQFEYERVREGVLTDTTLVRVPATGAERARASFVHADAAAISEEVLAGCGGPFDVVVMDAFLTRLRQPLDTLRQLHRYVRPGGLLVVTSNNDWQPGTTPRNSWLGGFKMNGEDQSTLAMLRYALKRPGGFELVETCDLARCTRSHERRFTLDVMQASLWRAPAATPAA